MTSSMEQANSAPPLDQYGQITNEFAWNLFVQLAGTDETRPPDMATSAATTLVQLAGISLGSGSEQGTREVEQLIRNASLDAIGNQLFQLGQHSSSYKWHPTTILVAPAGRQVMLDMMEQGKTKYGLYVRSCDMTSDGGRQAVAIINKMITDACSERIAEMMPRDFELCVGEQGQGVVAAASTYFHPWWNVRFDRKKTTESKFYETPQRARRVRMMHREDVLPYAEGQLADGVQVQMVALACRQHRGTMYFILPAKRFGLGEVIEKATVATLTDLIRACVPKSVNLWLPKTLLTDTYRVHPQLTAMGIRTWFEPTMTAIMGDKEPPLRITEIIQQTVVRINEDGEESYAVEKTEMKPADERQLIRVHCDQPFLFIFRHNASNAFWLVGSCSRPFYPHK